MIDDRGQVKVLDFGLAKQLNKEQSVSSEPEAQTLLSTETQSGVVLGTPAYLSPEQALSGAVDGRSDLFALGTLLYEAITGRTPFAGKSFIEIAANVLHVEPPPPSKFNDKVPGELDFIVLKALAKKPNKRYQSAREMIADLTAVKERLEEDTGQTLIRQTSPSSVVGPRTLANLSQMLQRPRIPVLYILMELCFDRRWGSGPAARPSAHVPNAKPHAGTRLEQTLRDGAYYQPARRSNTPSPPTMATFGPCALAEALVELDQVDLAKDELLRVNAADRATLSTLDSLTSTRSWRAPGTIMPAQIINKSRANARTEKPHVLVDLGALTTRIRSCRTPSPPTPKPPVATSICYGVSGAWESLRTTARDGAGARFFDKADTIRRSAPRKAAPKLFTSAASCSIS